MKKAISGRTVIMALLALSILAAGLAIHHPGAQALFSGSMASDDPNNILSKIPAYTYEGTQVNAYAYADKEDEPILLDAYQMGASGDYIDREGTVWEDIVDELGGGKMLVYQDVTEEGFNRYQDDLKLLGYRLYANNDLNSNLFATWVTEDTVVTLSLLKNDTLKNQFSILVEPMRDLPGLKEENVYKNLHVENKAVLITCSHVGKNNGLSLAFQLCDGSFILVDGGYGIGFYPDEKNSPDYQNAAKEIYGVLSHLAPDPNNIVIAAWFFTHPHYDHMGVIGPFTDLYSDTVTVERFVINQPNHDTIQEMYDLWKGGGNADANFGYLERMQNCFKQYEGAAVVEAHAGQTFYLRDAVIDILCTWETQTEYSATGGEKNTVTEREFMSINQMNSASLILDVDLGGERTVVLGDSGASTTRYLNLMYGTWLKTDIQTVAHHGFAGTDKNLNKYLDADVVLWPMDDISEYTDKSRNLPLQDADVIWAADKHITIIPLPYTGDADVIRFEAPVLNGKTWDEVYPN